MRSRRRYFRRSQGQVALIAVLRLHITNGTLTPDEQVTHIILTVNGLLDEDSFCI